MQSDHDTLVAGLRALTVLSIIPIILFALWVDHFEKHIHNLLIKRPTFDREIEIEKIRFGSLLVMLFQFTLFLGSEEIRKAFPLKSEFILILSVTIQLCYQAYVERKIQPNNNTSGKLLILLARATRSWLIAATICSFISILLVQITLFFALKLNLNHSIITFLAIISSLFGLSFGIAINFSLSPYHILKICPTSPILDLSKYEQILSTFKNQNLKIPKFWVIELEKFRIFDVLLTGLRHGKGPLTYSIFISRNAIDSLSHEELESLILIQISHLQLNHTKKRFFLTVSLILNSTLIAILTSITFQRLFPSQDSSELIANILGLISFLISARWISIQKQTQNFAADVHAIEKFNVSLKHLSSALRKLDSNMIKHLNPAHISEFPLMGYADTERRIYILKTYQAQKTSHHSNKETKSAIAS